MPPYTTKPAYIVTCKGWEPRLREHPIFDWMFDHEDAFDVGNAKSEPYTNWLTSEFALVDPTGKSSKGPEAWKALLQIYAPFSKHFHEPFFVMIFESETGPELFGCAKIFANFAKPGDGMKTKDLQGREWDVQAPGAFHFTFAKDSSGPKGMKMSSWKVFADGVPVVGAMIKRGMITPEDFMKKVAA